MKTQATELEIVKSLIKKNDKINILELEIEMKKKLYSIPKENENRSSSEENFSNEDQLNIIIQF